MNVQSQIAAIRQALKGEMRDALPLLSFLNHLDSRKVQSITWEVSEQERALSISIAAAGKDSSSIYFYYRNMTDTRMRKNAFLQLNYGDHTILGENGQFTIYRDEAPEVGGFIPAMLAAKATQKNYYFNEEVYKSDLVLEYETDGEPRKQVFTNKIKRKPLFASYQRVEERTLIPLVSRK